MPDPSPPPSARPNPVAPAGTPGTSGIATLAVGVTVVAALYFGQEVLVPIVLAVLLSFILAPVVDLLQRWRLGRVVPVVAAVLVALGVILALGSVIGVQVAQDRKSTRLNSSHVEISYAVFCLKKKRKHWCSSRSSQHGVHSI